MTTHAKSPSELLREFPFFAGLDEQTHAELLASAHTRRYAKGETLFLEGEPCKGLFFIQSGRIKIYKLSETGREQIIHIQQVGDAVAELPLFDNEPYPASAEAMDDSAMLFIAKAAFQEVLARRPQLSRAVIAALAMRLRKMVALVETLSLHSVRQRLARLLLEEAKGRREFTLLFTNEELAARLGSVRDVISRTMSGLQADHLIRLTGRRVEIFDAEALKGEES